MATKNGPPCGVMVSNDPRARCTKESDHDGPCDFVPDRHAATKEGSGEALGAVESASVRTQALENVEDELIRMADAAEKRSRRTKDGAIWTAEASAESEGYRHAAEAVRRLREEKP